MGRFIFSIAALALLSSFFYSHTLPPENQSAAQIPDSIARIWVSYIRDNMVLVQGGTFTMGCRAKNEANCKENEKPTHRVSVGSFYIGKFEITQLQYDSIMGKNPSHHKNCPDCPVEEVSWNDAQAFCKKLSALSGSTYRLPTEAEWEYAARGGKKMKDLIYSGSDHIDEVAWYNGNALGTTAPVGGKQPNKLGLYDMSGNVAEWCSDWYSDAYYRLNLGGNPQGPENGREKVIRGGSWDFVESYCSTTYRLWNGPSYKNGYTGFRVVMELK
jgi:formylglycine-generating enzyme required for sulfatase activity